MQNYNNKYIGDWKHAILLENSSIQDAIVNLDKIAIQIVLVCNKDKTLLGTISDGDIRRGLLKGLTLNSPIKAIMNKNPLVVSKNILRDSVLELMSLNRIRQVPVVDENNKLIGLHLFDYLLEPKDRKNTMVIMAGGRGKRLHPFTNERPKPMLEIAGKPILEHIIQHAKSEGFKSFIISINYLGHILEDYFGDGKKFNIKINYIREDIPLGTAGSLSLLPSAPNLPFIVTNGDVITDIKYGELLDFHNRHDASATMAVRAHEYQNPFGIVQTDGLDIVGFEEKPITRSHINAGVYVLNPQVLELLELGEHCDMPGLFERLQTLKKRTVAYPMHEPWLDVGSHHDLEIAKKNIKAEIKYKKEISK
ncbi:CBS domain-containing protein [Candidatus Methylopumilus rimovensis]|uniref:CBS domain-containing protein n=1 Tax=Candidatus Methylopumilus rimovensis TaxID=2588535 RepID=A0AAE6FSS7_9PROT|nr:nucleotidyltransferase family protein [Candidatus Methylopumilus rimovensis]QDD13368.1 CBS domain-containing protein [Candidatus Methylopumilus rimovensis]